MSVANDKEKLLSVLPITITSIVCFVIILLVHNITKEKISKNKEQSALAYIAEVIPVKYNNDLFTDNIELDVPTYINDTNKITVYRARNEKQPVAISIMPVITRGYNGTLSLLIGISYDGVLTGIKILQHDETEGFGDQAHQDNSNWLLGFNGYSLETPEEQWAVKKDGGEFDQLSGATITSRGIINVIYKVLKYYSENRDKFYL
jgi:H+/Na+-translocating ferredoxin:NAD+ oxidoreductase subunit G